ncbi:MAG: hypothetical protein WA919_23515 [Coleofasciculaceae cyanobacterium]
MPRFSWKLVILAPALGLMLWLTAGDVYRRWKIRDGWCARYYPDGSQEFFYGADCKQFSAH